MGKITAFRSSPGHVDDQQEASPDPETLQKVLAGLVSALSPARSQGALEIRIRNFRSDRFDLVDDLIVVLEERDGQYVANSYDTGQYGHGYSPDDAIQHLCSVLEDYYDLLLEDEGQLSSALSAHLHYLRRILRASDR